MTVQEAINDLQYNQIISDEAIDLAIEALQKQVPMKPVEAEDSIIWNYKCPVCGAYLKTVARNICNCGQRIDWSDKK